MAGRPLPSAVHSELVGDGAAAEAFRRDGSFRLAPPDATRQGFLPS
jgi:hypothetical protein